MMRFDPSLVVERFRVQRGQTPVYDEPFHTGVNIIRGENSSGKSTVLNLLFFALGGDLKDWSDTALLCDRAVVQVLLSGKRMTLARDISDQRGQPLEIFAGDLEEAMAAPADRWNRFPYTRSQSLASFSEVIFEFLKIPPVTTEAASSITMNQMLRLLYADQLSPVDSIFKFEQFDPPAIREATGRMLCGAFESEVYTNTLEIKRLEKEYEQVVGELRSFYRILGRADQSLTLDVFTAEQQNLLRERAETQGAIVRIETEAASTDVASVEASLLVEAYESLQRLQREMAAKRTASEALALEIADSASFIADLERKREALDDAAVVAEEIDHVHFQYCPSCHAPTETFDHACHLCKTPFDAEQGRRRVAAIITDFEAQLKQSRLLQQRRLARAEKLDDEVLQLARATTAAERNYADISRTPGTEERQLANQLQRKIGYIDRQLEGLEEKLKVAEVIAQLNDQKENLSAEVARLKARNESLNQQQHAKLVNAFSHIADEVRELLRGDVARQDSFTNPQNIDFSFSTNRITVDGNTYFSASSRVILRNSFFVGFFTAAAKHASFRHPRFLLMDSIEDKGMEVERAYNFQRMIVARVEAAPSESQVIFGTSMIAPDLDNDHYTVGDRSTQKQRTLKIKNMPERKGTQE